MVIGSIEGFSILGKNMNDNSNIVLPESVINTKLDVTRLNKIKQTSEEIMSLLENLPDSSQLQSSENISLSIKRIKYNNSYISQIDKDFGKECSIYKDYKTKYKEYLQGKRNVEIISISSDSHSNDEGEGASAAKEIAGEYSKYLRSKLDDKQYFWNRYTRPFESVMSTVRAAPQDEFSEKISLKIQDLFKDIMPLVLSNKRTILQISSKVCFGKNERYFLLER